MEGKRSTLDRSHCLRKIREFTKSILEDLSNGRLPVVSINRFRNYCSNYNGNCFCSYDRVNGKEVLTLQSQCHVHRLEQAIVDRAINDICILLECSRHHLNVVRTLYCLRVISLPCVTITHMYLSPKGNLLPNEPFYPREEALDIFSVAQYILVVEKESVFQRLADDCFCSTNRCIVITGRGYPDIATRRFLRVLAGKLHVPVYCLVDSDPYGFDILTTYRFGSMVRNSCRHLQLFSYSHD
ncbi:hypothetical protein Ancab_024993 [Ancistrocladus abbreviatus]